MGRTKSSSAMGIRAALVGLASVRANVKDILKKSEIERSIVDDPEGKLSLSQITKFWEVSSNVLNDPVIGLNMAELIPFGTYQTSDFLLSNSPTLREGLGRFVKFFDLIHQEISIKKFNKENQCEIELIPHETHETSRHTIEYEIALLFERLKYVTDNQIILSKVQFSHDCPAGISSKYEEIFKCDIKFNATHNSLCFKERYLDLTSKHFNSNLLELLENNAQKVLENIQKSSKKSPPFIEKFNTILKDELREGRASIQNMAKIFGMSPRTLQRKLKQYDLSYSQVLTDLRLELSKDLLGNNDLALPEIAFLLGFSETSAFHRAFKQWTQKTPLEYRKEVASN